MPECNAEPQSIAGAQRDAGAVGEDVGSTVPMRGVVDDALVRVYVVEARRHRRKGLVFLVVVGILQPPPTREFSGRALCDEGDASRERVHGEGFACAYQKRSACAVPEATATVATVEGSAARRSTPSSSSP